MRRLPVLLLLAGCASGAKEEGIPWRPWTDDVLGHAGKEKRLVLLALEVPGGPSVDPGCRDPEVLRLARSGFLAVKADPEARPDLAGPCQVRAWPAVLVLDADGRKRAERTGPLSPDAWCGLLKFPSGTSGPETRLDADQVERGLALARSGDAEAGRRLRERLAARDAREDPIQALRAFSRAWALWGDPAYVATARDLRARLAEGGIRTVRPLLAYADATGDRTSLEAAIRAAGREIPFRGLGDALEAGRAFLALHRSTGERAWFARAEEAARFIPAHFAAGEGGFRTAEGGALPPRVREDENAGVARFARLLFACTGKGEYREMAERARKAAPEAELPEPLHVVVVGAKGDARAAALFRAALARSPAEARVEWWDGKEGSLLNPDVDFPVLNRPAAYVCRGRNAGGPAFTPEDLRARIDGAGR